MIAHRVADAEAADKVLLLEDGCVAAFGRPAEVLPQLGKAEVENQGPDEVGAS